MAKSPEDDAGAGSPRRITGECGSPDENLVAQAEQEIAERIAERLPQGTPLDTDELAKVLAQVVSVEIREAYSFQGPMPPPKMLREYEEVLPGLAERIVARTEREQQFRHEATQFQLLAGRDQMRIESAKAHIGQILAFIIAMTAIGGGIYLLAIGKSIEGIVPIVGALVGLVAVFVVGKYIDSRSPAEGDGESGQADEGDGSTSQ